MNRRLRKKKHLGEFRQFGVSLECRFHPGLSPQMFDRFTDEFIGAAVETRSLLFGGGGSAELGWSGIVSTSRRYDSLTEEDRSALLVWLENRPEVAMSRLSNPWDIWHGADPFEPHITEHFIHTNRARDSGFQVEP
ncbi:MAG: YggL family protein [Verrucomicrobiales bacterium]|nr:YggL family protein [Verrucomicrobiales bacterium]